MIELKLKIFREGSEEIDYAIERELTAPEDKGEGLNRKGDRRVER